MINWQTLGAVFLALAIFVLIINAQTSQDPCPSGTPKCYSDLAPYAGHNLSASQLPPNLCPNGCAGDNRRVVVIRIDSSWGTQTNSNVWDAVQCAAAAWNNANDGASPPNKTGYYFVLDQANLTNVATADITVTKEDLDDLASCDVGHDNENPNRHNTIRLDPVNGTLGAGAGLNFNASDLCGRVAHELGHLIGVGEVTNCKSVMFGANTNGSRDVDAPQANDVTQVNRNFNAATRTNCQDTTPSGSAPEPIVNPTPTPTPTPTPELCWEQQFPCQWWEEWSPSECRCVGYPPGGYPPGCPVVIDLRGDGFNLTNNEDGVRFDLDDNGSKEKLSWTAFGSDDAWLTLDRNGNGTIDNGTELFGNFTPQFIPPAGQERNGFWALAEYDKAVNGGNVDGLITRADAVFGSLRLWQDLNHNGISEVTELFSLQAAGVRTIELDYKFSKKTDEHGNQFRYRAKIKDQQDAQLNRWAWDVFLIITP